jgi:diguanylate cyclase
MADLEENARTLAYAEAALRQMQALKHAATPRNFEIWYTYAAGGNQGLNQSINEILVRKGRLTTEDLTGIYEKHLSPIRFGDRIDEVGSKIVDKIGQVTSAIDNAIGTADSCAESLSDAQQQIGSADRDQMRLIVDMLMRATKGVESANQTLQSRLVDSRHEISTLQEDLEVVRSESLTDPLTTLSNRKYFEDATKRLVEEAANKATPLSIILTDVDHFKRFNDTYGHLTGDQVLRLVAIALKQNVKGQDVAARYGGEEFVVLLPRTALTAAATVADHIRRAVMGKELMRRSTGETLGRVTISAGVASWQRSDTVAGLLERADACLYAAKRAGRNCVVAETALTGADARVA